MCSCCLCCCHCLGLQGPYVLVLVAFQHGPQFRLLPAVWCVRAYHSLPRAFRKHVKHVVLLQPSFMVRAGLALLYPFVSSKAHAKIKQVGMAAEFCVFEPGGVCCSVSVSDRG